MISPIIVVPVVLLCAAGYFLLCLGVYKKCANATIPISETSIFRTKKVLLLFFAAILVMLTIAILVSLFITEYMDMGVYVKWAKDIAANGVSGVYDRVQDISDYPPVILYVLGFIGLITWNAPSWITEFVIFLLQISSHCAATFVFYKILKHYLKDSAKESIGALLFFINPAFVFDCAVWGQTDMFVVMFALLIFYTFVREKYSSCLICVFASTLIKSQIIFALPILAVIAVVTVVRKKLYKRFILTLLPCVVAYYLLCMPAYLPQILSGSVLRPFIGNINEQVNHFLGFSLNCQNFWAMIGLNLVFFDGVLATLMKIFSIAVIAVVTIFAVRLYYKKDYESDMLWLICGWGVVTIITFAIGMHERYVFSGCALLFVAALGKDKKFVTLTIAISVSSFINIALSYPFWQHFIDSMPVLVFIHILWIIFGGIEVAEWFLLTKYLFFDKKQNKLQNKI